MNKFLRVMALALIGLAQVVSVQPVEAASRVHLNNVSTKLTAAIDTDDVTINVTAGTGAQFAGATGGNWIIATIAKISGFKEIAREIVKVTARSTDALTIVRAQESTAALSFSVGDVVEVRPTAASFTDGYYTTLTASSTSTLPTINGSTAANGDITIQGTSDSTRTSSYVLLQPTAGSVGILTSSPTSGDVQIGALSGSNRTLYIGSGSNDYFSITTEGVTHVATITSGSAAAATTSLAFATSNAGTEATALTIAGTGAVTIPGTLGVTGAITGSTSLEISNPAQNGAMIIINDTYNGASNGYFNWYLRNANNAQTSYGTIRVLNSTRTAGAETGTMSLSVINAGASVDALVLTGANSVFAGTVTATTLIATASSSPASNAACTAGTQAWDATYEYRCAASGAWGRIARTGGY